MTVETRVINIEGMTCGGCVKSVNSTVTELAGVEKVEVDLEGNKATVAYDNQSISVDNIVEAIEEAGFDATIAS